MGVKLVVASDVQGDAKRVVGFATHLSEIKSRDGNGVVNNDLVVVPASMTAHSAIQTLQELFICIASPSLVFGNQTARSDCGGAGR